MEDKKKEVTQILKDFGTQNRAAVFIHWSMTTCMILQNNNISANDQDTLFNQYTW